jgi:glycosyltransferase involved in cell wall biosynthesis
VRDLRIAGHEHSEVRCLLLVRNGASHDARVLRAARVAQRTLGGSALVAAVATAPLAAGETTVEGVRVVRLAARRRAPRAPRAADGSASAAAHPVDRQAPRPGDGHTAAVARDAPARLTRRARIRRLFSGASFAWQALAVARRERPLLVHANDWNTMWCAAAIKLLCGARVVYDSHELWPDRNGRWEQRWWLLASEALFVRLVADATITASPGYAEALASRYRVRPPVVIRNIPEHPEPMRRPRRREHPTSRSPLVVYVGGLMPGRGLEQTIDALALAPEVRLRTVGPGSQAYRASLLERARAAGVGDRLELSRPVPPGAVTEALDDATAGLCLIQPVCRSYELTLPNKLFEYAAAGVPVLASDLPVLAAVVRGEGLGEVVPANDPGAIAAGLRRLLEPDRWSDQTRRTQAFACANNWTTEARRLAEVYTDLTAPHGARAGVIAMRRAS